MASILQNLISKMGSDDAYKLVNKMKGGASQLEVEDLAKYPKNITQDALADRQAFKMVGDSYPTDFTMVPEGASVPALRTQTLPQAIIPEVVDDINYPVAVRTASDVVPMVDDIVSPVAKKSGLGRAAAIGGGIGALGLGGLMMSGEDEPSNMMKAAAVKPAEQMSKPSQTVETKATQKASSVKPSQIAEQVKSGTPEIQKLTSTEKDDFQERLKFAQEQDSSRNLLFGLLKAAQTGGAALAGSKADTSFADTELKDQDKFVGRLSNEEKLKQQNKEFMDEQALRNPNSAASVQARDIARKVGLKITDDTTAMQLQKAGLNLSNLLTQKMSIDARKEQAALQREMLALQKEEKKGQKELENKMKAQKSVDAMVSQLGKSKALEGYQATKAAQAALDNAIAKGDKTSVGSAFMMYAKIAQGDNSVVRESDMKNLAGSYNYTSPSEMIAKLSAKAAGGTFTSQELQQMREVANLVERVKAGQVQQIINPIKTRIENYGLNAAESIDPAMLQEFSNLEEAPKSTTINKASDPKIQAYADQYGLDYKKAESILKARGYNGK